MLRRRGSSKEIRVSVFSNDLMTSDVCLGGEARARLYSPKGQREPLDQTNLRNGIDTT